jgi:hypothetical protein
MQFYDDVRSRLGHRQSGFDYIFNYLKTIEEPFIVETGCARQLDNYEGDGQSSLLFDKYIKEYGGHFWTVDLAEESVNYSKSKMTSENSVVALGDSITRLKELNYLLLEQNKKIDFLYLDSFDAPRDNPQVVQQSALHHLYELLTIAPSLYNGAVIGVDDNWIESRNGVNVVAGKGQFIFDYMNKSGRTLQQNGYQLFWIW